MPTTEDEDNKISPIIPPASGAAFGAIVSGTPTNGFMSAGIGAVMSATAAGGVHYATGNENNVLKHAMPALAAAAASAAITAPARTIAVAVGSALLGLACGACCCQEKKSASALAILAITMEINAVATINNDLRSLGHMAATSSGAMLPALLEYGYNRYKKKNSEEASVPTSIRVEAAPVPYGNNVELSTSSGAQNNLTDLTPLPPPVMPSAPSYEELVRVQRDNSCNPTQKDS